MTNYELTDVLEWMRDNDGLKLPHDEVPGTHNEYIYTDVDLASNPAAWEAYQWNPPQYHNHHTAVDSTVSPKPTWEELLAAREKVAFQNNIDKAKEILIHGDRDGKTPDVHKREFVINTGVKESVVEAAHNYVMDDYRRRLALVNDSTKPIKERITEADSLVRYVNSYALRLGSWVDVLISQGKS